MDQLKASAKKRNEMILNMTKSAGSEEVDMKLLEETLLEVERGWSEGPILLTELGEDTVISRRFPLVQGSKMNDR